MKFFLGFRLAPGSVPWLDEAMTRLAALDAGHVLRVEPAAKRHLTLLFLGEGGQGHATALAVALQAETWEGGPLGLAVTGLGAFPGVVVYAAIAGPDLERLAELRTRMQGPAAAAGFNFDRRPLVPHLTLARFRHRHGHGVRRVLAALPEIRPDAPLPWQPDTLELIASKDGQYLTQTGFRFHTTSMQSP